MTEPRGRAARWNSALLLVPGSAALLGAGVWWAAGTTPATSTPNVPQVPAHNSAADQRLAAAREAEYRDALERTIASHRRDSTRLRHRLAQLHTAIEEARKEETAARNRNIPPVSVAPVYNGGGGGGPVIAVAPPPPPAPPAVHAVSGSSGHP